MLSAPPGALPATQKGNLDQVTKNIEENRKKNKAASSQAGGPAHKE